MRFSEQDDAALCSEIAKQVSSVDGTPRLHVDPAAVSGASGCGFRCSGVGIRVRPRKTNGGSNQGRGQDEKPKPRRSLTSTWRRVGSLSGWTCRVFHISPAPGRNEQCGGNDFFLL